MNHGTSPREVRQPHSDLTQSAAPHRRPACGLHRQLCFHGRREEKERSNPWRHLFGRCLSDAESRQHKFRSLCLCDRAIKTPGLAPCSSPYGKPVRFLEANDKKRAAGRENTSRAIKVSSVAPDACSCAMDCGRMATCIIIVIEMCTLCEWHAACITSGNARGTAPIWPCRRFSSRLSDVILARSHHPLCVTYDSTGQSCHIFALHDSLTLPRHRLVSDRMRNCRGLAAECR
jgi:hypothetical protein